MKILDCTCLYCSVNIWELPENCYLITCERQILLMSTWVDSLSQEPVHITVFLHHHPSKSSNCYHEVSELMHYMLSDCNPCRMLLRHLVILIILVLKWQFQGTYWNKFHIQFLYEKWVCSKYKIQDVMKTVLVLNKKEWVKNLSAFWGEIGWTHCCACILFLEIPQVLYEGDLGFQIVSMNCVRN